MLSSGLSVDFLRRYSNIRYTQVALSELQNLAIRAGRHHRGGARPVRNVEVRLGDAAIRELVALYNHGAQSTDLMAAYGLSKSSVLSILRKHGGNLRRQGLSADQEALALQLREQGMSYLRIAERLGAAKSTVQLWLKQQAA